VVFPHQKLDSFERMNDQPNTLLSPVSTHEEIRSTFKRGDWIQSTWSSAAIPSCS